MRDSHKQQLQRNRDEIREQIARTALKYVGTREMPNNRGDQIDAWNLAAGAPVGSPWCASFVCAVIKETVNRFHIHPNKLLFVRSAHVKTMWNQNKTLRERYPKVGFIAVYQRRGTTLGHCGLVISVDAKLEHMELVEGNTSDGQTVDREGVGVFAKFHPVGDRGHFELLGFIDPLKMKWEQNDIVSELGI